MAFRVTQNFLNSQMLYYNQVRSGSLANLQFQASTGLRLSRASDDPNAAQQLFSLKRTSAQIETDIQKINRVESTLNLSVTNLTESHDLATAAQRLATQARTATSDEELSVYAVEAERILDRLAQLANSEDRGSYLFSGQASRDTPFVAGGEDRYPPYVYAGATLAHQVEISQNISISLRYSGREIFASQQRATTVFVGATGAAAGVGTDSALIQGELTVSHTSTTVLGGSGATAGTSSPGGDTIIGQAGTHRITVVDTSGTGASGTIQLNDGEPVDFTSADTDLLVRGPAGESIYLDTTGITAGFNGTVDLAAAGTLSIDGGATATAIDFSNNQQLQDPATGRVTNIDSSGINRVGVEHLEYTGTSDVFSAVAELRDDIRNLRGLNNSQLQSSLQRRADELERHANQLLDAIGQQSVALETLAALKFRNEDYQLQIDSIANETEAADLAEVVTRLQNEQNLLEFSYAVSSRVLNQNFLQFLG